MDILDELANRGRRVPRGPTTLLELLLMEPFERQATIDPMRDLVTDPVGTVKQTAKKVRRKKSKYGRELSKQLKLANKQARTRSGKLRKGMTPAKILKKAHRATKRRFR